MTDKRILFGNFEFPRVSGFEYLFDEKKPITDYLFVNEPHEKFSMYFENGFPIFEVPKNSERSYCLFEIKSPGRAPLPVLNAAQQAAVDGLNSLASSGEAKAALLFGVTGSGKTSV